MKAALLGDYCLTAIEDLKPHLTDGWTLAGWSPAMTDVALAEALNGAEAVVVGADALLSGRVLGPIRAASSLRLFQIPFSGYEWFDAQMLPPGCTACNIYTHGSTIAEYVMAAMLHWEINLARIDADFRAGSWSYGGSAGLGKRHGELAGKTLGLIGYGDIGQGVAKRAAAFDMRVLAVTRGAKPAQPPLSWHGALADLPGLLAQSDYVVLAVPMTPQTAHLIDAQALARMKPDAVLINVARGPVVNPADLFAALSEKRIGGAVLDTWYRYPTPDAPDPAPADQPFHILDNVVMTPHCAAWTNAHHQRRWAAIAANLTRLARGEPLADVID